MRAPCRWAPRPRETQVHWNRRDAPRRSTPRSRRPVGNHSLQPRLRGRFTVACERGAVTAVSPQRPIDAKGAARRRRTQVEPDLSRVPKDIVTQSLDSPTEPNALQSLCCAPSARLRSVGFPLVLRFRNCRTKPHPPDSPCKTWVSSLWRFLRAASYRLPRALAVPDSVPLFRPRFRGWPPRNEHQWSSGSAASQPRAYCGDHAA